MNDVDENDEKDEDGNDTQHSPIENIGETLGLSEKTVNDGAEIFSKALDYEVHYTHLGGKGVLAAVCLLVASEQNKEPLTSDEIVEEVKRLRENEVVGVVPSKHFTSPKVSKMKRKIQRELNMDYVGVTAEDVIDSRLTERFAGLRETAKRLLNRVPEDTLVGKSPRVVAGASIYLAGILEQARVRQKDLADALGVTTTAIRYTYSDMGEEITGKRLSELPQSEKGEQLRQTVGA